MKQLEENIKKNFVTLGQVQCAQIWHQNCNLQKKKKIGETAL